MLRQDSKREKSRERSRAKRSDKSESRLKSKKSKKRSRDHSDDSDRKKKKKKDKDSKRKDDKKKRSRSSSNEAEKEAERQRELNKLLITKMKLEEEPEKAFKPNKLYTFYQLMVFQLKKDTIYKQSMLTKMLVEQMNLTVNKTPALAEQVAIYSPLLRETRHLFSPSRELVNNKTLKIFATYQPYLNAIQSECMQDSGLEYIAEVVKTKNPLLYKLDIKAHKIMNIINLKIMNSVYDEEFILLMSELIIDDKPIFMGINRLVSVLKSPDLKRNEAVQMMLYEYIYKTMVEDDGLLTLLHIDQISAALLGASNEERQSYSKEMRVTLKFMLNYAMVFECFSKEVILKALAETFLKEFHFVSIEINKFL